ncbi:MAG: (4Fe-4S)-binding protein [Gilvibacter sp.]
MSQGKTKQYSNESLTVIWKPVLCIHAAECVKRLPEVYDPKARPWITPENASAAALKEQINACPSGALTYKMNDGSDASKNNSPMEESTKVQVVVDGPILVHGSLEIENSNGEKVHKTRVTAFCRCGASGDKPYCDGTHNKIDFKG